MTVIKKHAVTIRYAERKDISTIFDCIIALAKYEKMLYEVIATEISLEYSLFDKKEAEVIIAEVNNKAVGFALFYQSYSTFLSKSNLYLEDLFVHKEARGNGYGKALLSFLANIAIERKCSRLEWVVLDWNLPSIDFYKSLGARPLDDWTTFRIDNEDLTSLANYNK